MVLIHFSFTDSQFHAKADKYNARKSFNPKPRTSIYAPEFVQGEDIGNKSIPNGELS